MISFDEKNVTDSKLPFFLQDRTQCTGCGGCAAACSAKAIIMVKDSEGFLYPSINQSKCIQCRLCEKICPSIHSRSQNNFVNDFCYAVQSADEIRQSSSSGGIFTLLAQYVLEKGGYVCGAAFEKDWSVRHILIHNKQDLGRLRGSKYIQSDIVNVLPLVKTQLEKNKEVLFSGTPCQIAGLLAYLPKKYPNLLTVDCVCHGVPNNGIWQKYLKDNFAQQQIADIQFRNKAVFGWSAKGITFKFKDGSVKTHSAYLEGFNYNLYLRPSCSACKYTTLTRQSDFTLGDFWGIEAIDPSVNDGRGTSLLLIHSNRGMAVFKDIQVAFKLYRKYPKSVLKNSPNYPLYRSSVAHKDRALFFKNFHLTHFNSLVRQLLYGIYDIGLVGSYTVKNYGNNIQYYCLYHTIKKAGFSVLMIERPLDALCPASPDLQPLFRKNPYEQQDQAALYANRQEMKQLNQKVGAFLVGSDQLFRKVLYEVFGKYVSLDWVSPLKRKAVYGLSFGVDFCEYSSKECKKLSKKLQSFSMISFREKSAIALAKKKFGKVAGPWVLDPVFLVERDLFEALSKQSTYEASVKNVFCYILDQTVEKSNLIQSFAASNQKRPLFLTDAAKEEISAVKIEDWLKLLQNSGAIITDSFHAMCFALIFEKEFFVILNSERGATRFIDFLNALGLSDRIVLNPQDMLKPYAPINWAEVNKKLRKYRQVSKDWLYQYLAKTQEPFPLKVSIEIKRKTKYFLYVCLWHIVSGGMKSKIEKKLNKYKKENFYAKYF